MDSSSGGQGMTPAGFPHSEICGSQAICASPQLIAAYHVLHRLLTPRHPPCALSSLTEHFRCSMARLTRQPVFSCQRSSLSKSEESDVDIHEIYGSEERSPLRRVLPPSRTANLSYRGVAALRRTYSGITPGGDSRDRTGNLRLAKPALSQLSYIP